MLSKKLMMCVFTICFLAVSSVSAADCGNNTENRGMLSVGYYANTEINNATSINATISNVTNPDFQNDFDSSKTGVLNHDIILSGQFCDGLTNNTNYSNCTDLMSYLYEGDYDANYNDLIDLVKYYNGTLTINNDTFDNDFIDLLGSSLGIGYNNSFILLNEGDDFKIINEKICKAKDKDIILFEGNFTQENKNNAQTIVINKPLKLIGNHNFLNAEHYTKIFDIQSDDVLFVNLNLVNSRDMELDVVGKKYKNILFINCEIFNILDSYTYESYDFNNKKMYTTHKIDISSQEDYDQVIRDSKTYYDNLIINFKPLGNITLNSANYAFIKCNCGKLVVNGNGFTLKANSKPFMHFFNNDKIIVENANYFLVNTVNAEINNITLEGFNGAIINRAGLTLNNVHFINNDASEVDVYGDCVTNYGILTSINSTYENHNHIHRSAIYNDDGTLFNCINNTFINNCQDIYLGKTSVLKFYQLPGLSQNFTSLKTHIEDSSIIVKRSSLTPIVKDIIINSTVDLKKLKVMVEDIKHIDALNVVFNSSGEKVYSLSNDVDVFLHPLINLNIEGNNVKFRVNNPKINADNHFISNSMFFNNIVINNLFLEGFNTAVVNFGQMCVSNCTFNKNKVQYAFEKDYGGAIWNFGYLLINSCIFTDNSAKYGGAIFNSGNLILMGNNVFKGNSAYSNHFKWSEWGSIFAEKLFGGKDNSIPSDNYYNDGVLQIFSVNNTVKDVYEVVKDSWNWKNILMQIVSPVFNIGLMIGSMFCPALAPLMFASMGCSMVCEFSSALVNYYAYKNLGAEVNSKDDRYFNQLLLPQIICTSIEVAFLIIPVICEYKIKLNNQKLISSINELKTQLESYEIQKSWDLEKYIKLKKKYYLTNKIDYNLNFDEILSDFVLKYKFLYFLSEAGNLDYQVVTQLSSDLNILRSQLETFKTYYNNLGSGGQKEVISEFITKFDDTINKFNVFIQEQYYHPYKFFTPKENQLKFIEMLDDSLNIKNFRPSSGQMNYGELLNHENIGVNKLTVWLALKYSFLGFNQIGQGVFGVVSYMMDSCSFPMSKMVYGEKLTMTIHA